jgi:hypothetical protein
MNSNKEAYAQAVCYFLAELLRNHKVALARAAEISQKVLDNINLIDSEAQFLKFIKELSLDFEELIEFTYRIDMHLKAGERALLENRVREFVISVLPTDLKQAAEILQDAVKESCEIAVLYQKFPQFKQFIETHD